MSTILRNFILIFLLLPSFSLSAQQLNLEPGEKYRIMQSFTQNTITESSNIRGNVSLDIRCSLTVEIIGEMDSLGYNVACQYEGLALSLFSPDLDITISSETRGTSLIIKYLNLLEEHKFSATLSPFGEILNIENLDDQIHNYYNIPEERMNEQDIIIKTIREAFGEDALTGFFNLSMNVYCNGSEGRCVKDVTYSFNAKPVVMHNSFFLQPDKDGRRRIQGLGIIETREEEIEFEGGSIFTSLDGNQTFDHLYDAESGWLLEGNSKQKIFLKSVFHGNNELPEGLEIPSVTETDFEFWGEKVFAEEKKYLKKRRNDQ